VPRPWHWPARKQLEQTELANQPQGELARRALVEPRQGLNWRRIGVAVLAVSVLGVGTAGSVVVTGNAERPLAGTTNSKFAVEPAVEVSVAAGVPRPQAFARGTTATERPSRDGARPALTTDPVASTRVVQARASALRTQARAAQRQAAKLAKKRAAERAAEKAAERARRKALLGNGRPVLPVAGGRTAASFGATGAWARYHTGIDYSAGSGTPVRAPRAGVVTSAGGGKASGWAGTYVTIRHSDGTSSLYAHLSSAGVSDGERIDAGETIGRVGQTGRAFGPHLHFEIYPSGVEPGDVYEAVDPDPWLDDLGL
jgi:murein DD-endopeptidase MepM/ murein hydrolase activator NlpD